MKVIDDNAHISFPYPDICIEPQSLHTRIFKQYQVIAYLNGWRNAFRDQEASPGCALRVVLGHQIVGKPDAIGLFHRALR
jgi:hypothetical protein